MPCLYWITFNSLYWVTSGVFVESLAQPLLSHMQCLYSVTCSVYIESHMCFTCTSHAISYYATCCYILMSLSNETQCLYLRSTQCLIKTPVVSLLRSDGVFTMSQSYSFYITTFTLSRLMQSLTRNFAVSLSRHTTSNICLWRHVLLIQWITMSITQLLCHSQSHQLHHFSVIGYISYSVKYPVVDSPCPEDDFNRYP